MFKILQIIKEKVVGDGGRTEPDLFKQLRSFSLLVAAFLICSLVSNGEETRVHKAQSRSCLRLGAKITVPVMVVSVDHISSIITPRSRVSQEKWTDRSPHKSTMVYVNGVELEYLDWGGKGKTLLFLAGFGNSAHIFDDIAPKFTDCFHVLALTRRGHGRSQSPTSGYDLPTLTEDIHQFLDQLKIKRVVLVGHSFAGDEMTRFATLFPKRVDKLIYLDAAYDRGELADEAFKKNPFPTPKMTDEERGSMKGYRMWWERTRGFWSDAVENDLHETSVGPDGTIKSAVTREVGQGIMKNATDFRPNYGKIKARTLAMYATVNIPYFVPADQKSRLEAQTFLENANEPYQRRNIEKLKLEMPKVTIVKINNSHHYLFIKNQNEVVREMRKFLK